MRSNYRRIGDFIRPVKVKNSDGLYNDLQGINIDKFFMPSVANTVGVDLKKYKIIKQGQFACNRMHVGRDYRIPIALSDRENPFIVSPAYDVFEIKDKSVLLPDYLMMWFSRKEFDRNAWFYTDADVRGGLPWKSFCDIELPIPSIEKQREIVKEYNTVVNRIKLNEQLNQKLEETAQALYKHWFVADSKENWDFHKLSDFIEISGGYSYQGEKLGKGETYLLGMGCVSFIERFLEKGMRLYSDDVPEKHLVGSGEIVIATRQQTENFPILGAPSIIPKSLNNYRMVVASNLYRVNNKSRFGNNLIFQLLRSDEYKEHIKLNAKGTTVGMITKSDIEDFTFRFPDNNTVFEFEKKLNVIADRIDQCTLEVKKLEELKSLLLTKMTKIEQEKVVLN